MDCSFCPSQATEIPCEVWHDIFLLSKVEDILMFERTCRFFRDVLSSRHLWLRLLQSLDQAHAPDLPPHISISSLSYQDLRSLVVRARRRVLNCTGSSLFRVSREIIIPVGQGNVNGILGQPFGWGADTLLLPGGQYFFMKWPAGYLQCWDVATKECMWTYPDIPQGTPDVHEVLAKCCFACDVQNNGDVSIVVISEIPNADERKLEILSWSPPKSSLTVLFEMKPVELDVFHGIPVIAKLCGGVVIAYTEGNLTVSFWKENRSSVVVDGIFDALEIVDDHIIGVTGSYDGNSLVAIPLSFIYSATTAHIKLGDIPISPCRITPPAYWLVGRAQLSVCKFHWQEKSQRQDIVVTVLGDIYNEQNCCDFPVAEFFSFGFDNSKATGAPDRSRMFIPLGRSEIADFNPQYSTYSVMTPPSQAGSTVLAFHDDRSHETRFSRTFATFTPGRPVSVCALDDAVIGGKPATFSLNVEFYSGAVHYVTRNLEHVVIRYLD